MAAGVVEALVLSPHPEYQAGQFPQKPPQEGRPLPGDTDLSCPSEKTSQPEGTPNDLVHAGPAQGEGC